MFAVWPSRALHRSALLPKSVFFCKDCWKCFDSPGRKWNFWNFVRSAEHFPFDVFIPRFLLSPGDRARRARGWGRLGTCKEGLNFRTASSLPAVCLFCGFMFVEEMVFAISDVNADFAFQMSNNHRKKSKGTATVSSWQSRRTWKTKRPPLNRRRRLLLLGWCCPWGLNDRSSSLAQTYLFIPPTQRVLASRQGRQAILWKARSLLYWSQKSVESIFQDLRDWHTFARFKRFSFAFDVFFRGEASNEYWKYDEIWKETRFFAEDIWLFGVITVTADYFFVWKLTNVSQLACLSSKIWRKCVAIAQSSFLARSFQEILDREKIIVSVFNVFLSVFYVFILSKGVRG